MIIAYTIKDLRHAIRRMGGSVAFVPTMGSLHEGHVSLVTQAREAAECVVASIFVNRLQFLPTEDFDKYPRTFEQDISKLSEAKCDILFAPDERQLYPQPQTFKMHPPAELASILEGKFRPGFFVGVSTVVMKLFQCVDPNFAFFGKKDYQQLMVIKEMVKQFAMDICIVESETVREADGLAMSSRNAYLSPSERKKACELNIILKQMVRGVQSGDQISMVEDEAFTQMCHSGWEVDYMEVRRRSDLQKPELPTLAPLVVLGAARLGNTRLIDNIEF